MNKLLDTKVVGTTQNHKTGEIIEHIKPVYKQIVVRIGFDYWEVAKKKSFKKNKTLKKYLEGLIKNDK